MARTHKGSSIVFNNYVCYMMLGRVTVDSEQSSVTIDKMFMPAPFRVSHVQWLAYDITNTVAVGLKNPTKVQSVTGNMTLADGVISEVATGAAAMVQNSRNFDYKDAMRWTATTDDTPGVITAGQAACLVTGYHTGPMHRCTLNQEPGQQAGQRPVSGYYCVIPFTNLRESNNQTLRRECMWKMPFDCRVMNVYYDLRGHTEDTGTIDAKMYNETDTEDIAETVDLDVNEQFFSDVNTGVAVVEAARDLERGDEVGFHLRTGASDTVPTTCATAHMLVWVTGHVRDEKTYPDVAD